MKKQFYIILSLLIISFTACSDDEQATGGEGSQKEKVAMEFTVEAADMYCNLQGDGFVYWEEKEAISIFSSELPSSNEKFQISADDISGRQAQVNGTAVAAQHLYALYPYDAKAKLEGGNIVTSFPAEQMVVTDSYEKKLDLSVGKAAPDGTLALINACGLVEFTMPDKLYGQVFQKVRFSGGVNEPLAGTIKIAVANAPSVTVVPLHSKRTIELNGEFEPGKTYSFVVPSLKLEKGFILTFHNTDGYSFQYNQSTATEIHPGATLSLGKINPESFVRDYQIVDGIYHLYTLNGLREWTEVINGGETATGAVLEDDIDMTGVTDWSPIGSATCSLVSNKLTVSGQPFTGVFDGNNHSILNFKTTYDGAIAGGTFGLFGILEGATVKNLTIGSKGDASSFTVKTSGQEAIIQETGVLAGVCSASTISNCVSYVPIHYDGTSKGRVTVGLVGLVFGRDSKAIIENVENHGNITIETNGNTTSGSATAIHVGGICGYSTSDPAYKQINEITYCENYGNVTSNSGRTAGILAAAISYTRLNSCFNHGNQINSSGTTGRIGGICCVTGNGADCSLIDCINNGDVISTNGAYCGGLICAPLANIPFSGCANYGKVITDAIYRGLFVAYNGKFLSGVNSVAGGEVGIYNGNSYIADSYTESNQIKYLGNGILASNMVNTTYQIGASGGGSGTGPEPELRILFIGNSFTQDAVHLLPNLIEEGAGIKTVKLAMMYYGGSIIEQHNQGYVTNTTNFTYYAKPTGVGAWISYKGYSVQDIVKSDDWDIISIQEHTGRTFSWVWSDAEKSSINELVNKIKADQPRKTPKIVYIMSQAYHNMDKSGDTRNTFGTTSEHYASIVAQGKKVVNETSVEMIIPTGTVLQNLRSSSLNNTNGLTRDGYHMDYGLSRYAAASAVFEMLITPKYGVNMDANTFRYTQSSTDPTAYSTPVTDANKPIAIKAARAAIQKPFEVTSIQ